MDYKKLIADFHSGKLDRNRVKLYMDNDDGFLSVDAVDDSIEAIQQSEHQQSELGKEYGYSNGHEDVVEILNAAGVPARWV